MIDAKANRAKFERIVFENIKRDGTGDLMDWLDKTDFFTAPASAKFHLAAEGGLCDHSLRVYELLDEKFRRYILNQRSVAPAEYVKTHSWQEMVAIAGLFHDVCKANFYIKNFVKDSEGNILIGNEKARTEYEVEDLFPVGHGEKSVFLLQRFIKLTDMEIAMIRWHMAAYDPSIHFDYPNGYAYQNAVKLFPMIYLMITADMEAAMLEGMM